MTDLLVWLYLTNAVLLINHEIDSAYWKEWELFKLPGPDVEYQTIVAADRLVVIALLDHPLAGRGGIQPADLKGHSFITREIVSRV